MLALRRSSARQGLCHLQPIANCPTKWLFHTSQQCNSLACCITSAIIARSSIASSLDHEASARVASHKGVTTTSKLLAHNRRHMSGSDGTVLSRLAKRTFFVRWGNAACWSNDRRPTFLTLKLLKQCIVDAVLELHLACRESPVCASPFRSSWEHTRDRRMPRASRKSGTISTPPVECLSSFTPDMVEKSAT